MNRWKAAALHLLISFLVIGGIALIAFLLWYPTGLYHLAGQDRILLVMLGIDLAAGPLLTLIVFSPGKKSLRFDLTVIALCQAALLGWGLLALWQTRPAFLVAGQDRFTLLFASEIDPADLPAAARPEWRRLPWTGPRLVAAPLPEDPGLRRQAMDDLLRGGPGIERTPRWYSDYADVAPRIARNAKRIETGSGIPAEIVNATGVPAAQVRWVPIHSRHGSARMLIDTRDGSPLRVVP